MVKGKHMSKETQEKIIKVIREGLDVNSIKERFGISHVTICKLRKIAKKTSD